MEIQVHPDETLESLSKGRLRIIQKKQGYRYSIDAILLAHFCRLRRKDSVVDLGTGNAIIPILLTAKTRLLDIVGVEIQDGLIDMARRNVLINKMEGKITLLHRDVRDLPASLDRASFDVAISNPPYRPAKTGRVNPDPEKAVARHEILGSLEDMAQSADFLLRLRGRFYVIYPASRVVDVLLKLRGSNLEPKRIQLVHPNARENAKLVLVEAVKGGQRELQVMKPLFVYDLDGHMTEEMDRIYTTFEEPGSGSPQGSGHSGQVRSRSIGI